MYALVQAGIIAYEALKEHLKPYGYAPARITQGLCTHQDRDIHFTLVIENFGIKYRNLKDANHLIAALQEKYEVNQYWTGGPYCVITLRWNYTARLLDISMPRYVKYSVHKFQHPTPTRPQHSSHQWISPNYVSTAPQLAHPTDDSPALNPDEARNFQQVVGTFLYYAHSVDPTMLVILNSIASEQSKGTHAIAKKVVQLLNYTATHP